MSIPETDFDVVIIGGGAAGMMAAATAASKGARVVLLEKNTTLGNKLAISGGGRCNITNNEPDVRVLLSKYGGASDFLFSPFSQFNVKDTFAFFESNGLSLDIQANKRVFPQSEKAADVVKLLSFLMKKHGVTVKTNCQVKKIQVKNSKITGLDTSSGLIKATRYILATGGVSHPETGSTGDGFEWLRQTGHSVAAPTPTIVPLAVNDSWIKSLPGISLAGAKIAFYVTRDRRFSVTGPILFTHFGLSGPTILNAAGRVADLLEEGTVTAIIDVYPQLNHAEVEKNLLYIFDSHKNKAVSSAIKLALPPGVDKAIKLLLPDLDFEGRVHSLSKADRKRIVHMLKAMPCSITGLMGFDRAVVADGGVALSEIDTRTMKSKLMENLYITGDLLHINRPSGGYSLQLCWTTGFVAGQAASTPN